MCMFSSSPPPPPPPPPPPERSNADVQAAETDERFARPGARTGRDDSDRRSGRSRPGADGARPCWDNRRTTLVAIASSPAASPATAAPPLAAVRGRFNVSLSGTFGGGTVRLQRSFDGGSTWLTVSKDKDGNAAAYTASADLVGEEPEDGVVLIAWISAAPPRPASPTGSANDRRVTQALAPLSRACATARRAACVERLWAADDARPSAWGRRLMLPIVCGATDPVQGGGGNETLVSIVTVTNASGVERTNEPVEFGFPLSETEHSAGLFLKLYDDGGGGPGAVLQNYQFDNHATDLNGATRFAKGSCILPSLGIGASQTRRLRVLSRRGHGAIEHGHHRRGNPGDIVRRVGGIQHCRDCLYSLRAHRAGRGGVLVDIDRANRRGRAWALATERRLHRTRVFDAAALGRSGDGTRVRKRNPRVVSYCGLESRRWRRQRCQSDRLYQDADCAREWRDRACRAGELLVRAEHSPRHVADRWHADRHR